MSTNRLYLSLPKMSAAQTERDFQVLLAVRPPVSCWHLTRSGSNRTNWARPRWWRHVTEGETNNVLFDFASNSCFSTTGTIWRLVVIVSYGRLCSLVFLTSCQYKNEGTLHEVVSIKRIIRFFFFVNQIKMYGFLHGKTEYNEIILIITIKDRLSHWAPWNESLF